MSLLPEENNTPEVEEEESTIFGASPTKQLDSKAKKGGKMLRNIIVSVVVLALLAGSAFAIVKLIPKPEDDTTENTDETVEVISIEHEKVKSVKIDRGSSLSVYNTTLKEEEGTESGEKTTSVTWTIEGVDPSLTETTSISRVMDTVLALKANRKIEKEDGADYGFAAPTYTVTVTGYDAADSVTLTVGKETPTSSGYYATTDGETIVLLDSADVEDFATPDTEMAVSEIVAAAAKNDGNADYFEEETFARVDYIALSGKNYPQYIRFEMNDMEDISAYMSYVMTAPSRRFADMEKVTELFNIAANGLSSASAYCLNPTAAELQSFGLTSPDVALEIKYGGTKILLKAALQQDGSYAVIAEGGKNIIFKVDAASLGFATYKLEDFASDTVFIEMITELSSLTLATPDKTYTFGIRNVKAENEDEDDVLTVTYGDKTLTTENFQNYYQYLVGTELNEIASEKTAGTPALTLTAVRNSGTKTTVKFIKHSDRRYYVEVDGEPMGYISSSYMDKILNYLDDVAEDKTVPEPY